MKIKNLFKRSGASDAAAARKDGFAESVECGAFTLDFYYDQEDVEKCKVEIRCGVLMDVVLKAAHEGYGFLMSCLQDRATNAMEAYCGMLWRCSHLLATESRFPKRINQIWDKYIQDLEKRAKLAANGLKTEQIEADEALMNEAVRIAGMSDEERAQMAERIIDGLKTRAESGEAVAEPVESEAPDVEAAGESAADKPKKK